MERSRADGFRLGPRGGVPSRRRPLVTNGAAITASRPQAVARWTRRSNVSNRCARGSRAAWATRGAKAMTAPRPRAAGIAYCLLRTVSLVVLPSICRGHAYQTSARSTSTRGGEEETAAARFVVLGPCPKSARTVASQWLRTPGFVIGRHLARRVGRHLRPRESGSPRGNGLAVRPTPRFVIQLVFASRCVRSAPLWPPLRRRPVRLARKGRRRDHQRAQ